MHINIDEERTQWQFRSNIIYMFKCEPLRTIHAIPRSLEMDVIEDVDLSLSISMFMAKRTENLNMCGFLFNNLFPYSISAAYWHRLRVHR